MTRAGVIRFPVQPRLVPVDKVARRLGVTLAVFEQKLPELLAKGFPAAEPTLGTYSLEAVDKWIDASAGLTPASGAVSDPSSILERVRQKRWAR